MQGGIAISYKFSIIVPAYNVEKRLASTLDSLVNQSFQNFEVIIVNDGSIDSTQEIIDLYCSKYSNFVNINQKNQGVAAARNNAIEIAKGEYLGFLDGDGDLFREKALEHFKDTIDFHSYHNNSTDLPELIIGRQIMVDPWSENSYFNAKELSLLDDIKPYDDRILWTMSLCNKVFLRDKVLKTGLKMPIFSYASDGGFLLPYVYRCNKIVGCPHEILIYNKRLFFEEFSISQTSTTETLIDYLAVHELILVEFKNFYNKNNSTATSSDKLDRENRLSYFNDLDYKNYLDALLFRQYSIILGQFYRFFWRNDYNTFKKIKEVLNTYKTDLSIVSWKKLILSNKDIKLDDIIIDKRKMSENPFITIVLNDFEETTLKRIFSNIYNAQFPSFELIISQNSFDILDENIKDKENIQAINSSSPNDFKNIAINKANGDYILFVEDDVLLSPKVLFYMFKNIVDSENDFVIMAMESLIEEDISKENYNINKFSKTNLIYFNTEHDKIISNKLINVHFLKKNNFKFSENIVKDIEKLYKIGVYEKFKGSYILSTNQYLKDPFISVFIDNMDINKKNLHILLESIYSQTFNSFDVFINSKLLKLLKTDNIFNTDHNIDNKFLNKSNIKIIEDNHFKDLAIKESNAKYGIFVNIPIIFDKSTFKDLFFKIEEENLNDDIKNSKRNYDFVSAPIYQYNCAKFSNKDEFVVTNIDKVDGNKINSSNVNIDSIKDLKEEFSEFHCNFHKKREIKYFSSQELIYSHKNISIPSSKSSFMIFDLYLSNKLIKLDFLRKNNILTNNNYGANKLNNNKSNNNKKDINEEYKDVLRIYNESKFLKIDKKLIFTKLSQNTLFNSISNNKIPLNIKLLFKIHKLFFIILSIRRSLKNGGK